MPTTPANTNHASASRRIGICLCGVAMFFGVACGGPTRSNDVSDEVREEVIDQERDSIVEDARETIIEEARDEIVEEAVLEMHPTIADAVNTAVEDCERTGEIALDDFQGCLRIYVDQPLEDALLVCSPDPPQCDRR